MKEGFEPFITNGGYRGIQRVKKEASSVESIEGGFPSPDGSHLSEKQRTSLRDLLSKIRLRHVVYAAMATAAIGTGTEVGKSYRGYDAPAIGSYAEPEPETEIGKLSENVHTEAGVTMEKTAAYTTDHTSDTNMSELADPAVADTLPDINVFSKHGDQEVSEAGGVSEQVSVNDVPKIRPVEQSISRPIARPDYVESVPHGVYESIPVDSKKFLTAVETTRQFITMSEGALVLNDAGEVLGVSPAGEVSGVMPSAGYIESGHVIDGFSGEWQNAVRRAAARELNMDTSDLTLNTSVWVDLQNGAEKLGVYPESISAMALQFAETSVAGTDLNRLEYLRTNFHIPNKNMPHELKDALETVILGIPGEESRFDDTVVSSADAHTAFQILPSTWEGMGYPPFSSYEDGVPPYHLQVEAFGRHIGNIYNEIHTPETSAQLDQIQDYFNSEADYHAYFLVPLIINAYNTGGGTMRAAVSAFVASPDFMDMKGVTFEGYDVFDRLRQVAYESDEGALANYQEWSMQYPVSVMAYARVFNEAFGEHSYRVAGVD